jgi:hypothetical protein
MPENTEISFAEWWKFESATVSVAWKSTNKIRSAFWGFWGATLMAILQFRELDKQIKEQRAQKKTKNSKRDFSAKDLCLQK